MPSNSVFSTRQIERGSRGTAHSMFFTRWILLERGDNQKLVFAHKFFSPEQVTFVIWADAPSGCTSGQISMLWTRSKLRSLLSLDELRQTCACRF
jgi:hypothetical protein